MWDGPDPRSNQPASPGETGLLPALTLCDTEARIFDLLGREPCSIDDIIRRSGLPASAVSVTPLGLEMKRLVTQLPGKMFLR